MQGLHLGVVDLHIPNLRGLPLVPVVAVGHVDAVVVLVGPVGSAIGRVGWVDGDGAVRASLDTALTVVALLNFKNLHAKNIAAAPSIEQAKPVAMTLISVVSIFT